MAFNVSKLDVGYIKKAAMQKQGGLFAISVNRED